MAQRGANKDAAWKAHWVLGTNDAQYAAYTKTLSKHKYTALKVGDRIPIKGIDVLVVNSAGKTVASP